MIKFVSFISDSLSRDNEKGRGMLKVSANARPGSGL
jgi:hypothetical protein